MRKLFYLIILGAGIIGCSTEPIETEALESFDANVKAQEADKSMTLAEAEICYGDAPVFVFDFPQNENGPHDVDTDVKIQMETFPGSGEWESFLDLTYSGEGPVDYSYEDETFETGTYSFRAKIESGGFNYFATLEVVDCFECTNELTTDLTCGELNVLNITFTTEEAGPIVIQGGLTNGTKITHKESNVLEANEDHPGVLSSNANVTRWEGEVDACEEVTITIEFEGGDGIGDWTAENVDEEVLAETEEQECDEDDE